ncbi:MAG: response regulator [Acetatifactor sp.]|nr:response regulator [Acetatifactor sp.]
MREGKILANGEQKNIVCEVLEVFDSFALVNLEQNTYAFHSRTEDEAHSKLTEEGTYTDLLRSAYSGIYPLGDGSATLEEYLNPVSIRRQMTPDRELLQWEYEDREKFHKTLYAMCVQREDGVPISLFLTLGNGDCQLKVSGFFETMETSLDALAEMVPDTESRETGQECLKQEDYQGRRVLVVEDNVLNREIAEDFLRMTGVEVETVVNGKEAVSQVAAVADGYYDLILMDVQTPVMNGHDAARAIRLLDKEHAGCIPIVAMVAGSLAEDTAVREAGMNGCLTKPICPCQLMEVLGKFLA